MQSCWPLRTAPVVVVAIGFTLLAASALAQTEQHAAPAPPAAPPATPAPPAAPASTEHAMPPTEGKPQHARKPSPPGAYVYIGWPNDGMVLRSTKFKVWFGTRN